MTGYEEIKENLIKSGFELQDDIFVKVERRTQSMSINGQPIQREVVQKIQFKYEGEGVADMDTENEHPIYGFSLEVEDGISPFTVWVKDWEDFQKLLS